MLRTANKMQFSTEDPFQGPVPQSIPLPQTPLTAVLAQIRFPEVLSITRPDFVSEFQEEIRADYPNCEQSAEYLIELRPSSGNQAISQKWTFDDSNRRWRTTLATGFLALETRSYTSRTDFIARFALLADALSKTIQPRLMTRIGIRYVDRIYGDALPHLSRFVRPEVLGTYSESRHEKIEQTWTQLTARANPGKLTTRWGLMPQGMSHEPNLMPPIDEVCWFLDTDAYLEFEEPEEFESTLIRQHLECLANRSFGFFRWAVSDEFLIHCGAEL